MDDDQRKVEDQAFVTLATNDAYSIGALVLGQSLRKVSTTRKLVVMVSPGVSEEMKEQLRSVFDHIEHVDVLDSQDAANLTLLTRTDLGVTFTKLHCWRLTQFTKCVFLDADTLVIQNVDDLFEREELSAAPDAGWPDCFNSGVFVYRPSLDTYMSLLQFAVDYGSFDGGDQGLLNLYFSDWATKDIARHLPFVYNVVSQAFYSYLPAFKQYSHNIKIIHFIGATKPWHYTFNTATGKIEGDVNTLHKQRFLQLWWSLFLEKVQPHLDPNTLTRPEMDQLSSDVLKIGIVGGLAKMRLGAEHYSDTQLDDRSRQFAWERGQIDYCGIDSFDNIRRQLDKRMSDGDSTASSKSFVVGQVSPP